MDDSQIVELYWERSENAIAETSCKYGRYLSCISFNILHNREDTEECVNDTYMRAWNAMPDKRPQRLAPFLGKITRNLSLNRIESQNAEKRGGGHMATALDELEECIPSRESVEREIDDIELTETVNRFLDGLHKETRRIFVRRYWYLATIKEISEDFGIGESKVKMTLLRTRKKLKQFLEKEGVSI